MDNAEVRSVNKKSKNEKAKMPRRKKKALSITVFVVGLVTLVVGVVLLVLNLTRKVAIADGEYLMSAEKWTLTDCGEEDCEKVVWKFTEIGKGTLTTDGGEHNYNFEWAIREGELQIQTDWLYELDNEYEYILDQDNGVLTLMDEDHEYRFTSQ